MIEQTKSENLAQRPAFMTPFFYWKLLTTLWRLRIFPMCTVAIAAVCASVYLHVTPRLYMAELKLEPVRQQGMDGANSLLSLVSSSAAAKLVGGKQTSSPIDIYVEALKDRDVSDILSRDPKIMRTIFAKSWDDETNSWHRPSGPVHAFAGFAKTVLGIPRVEWHPPDTFDVQDYIVRHVTVATDPRSDVITLLYEDRDPQTAVYFLSAVNDATDHSLKQRALSRATQYIDYLTRILPSVTVTEQRGSLINLLSQQQQTAMMAKANVAYVAEPIGRVASPNRPAHPRTLQVFVLALLLGLVFGIALALTADAISGSCANTMLARNIRSRRRGGSRNL